MIEPVESKPYTRVTLEGFNLLGRVGKLRHQDHESQDVWTTIELDSLCGYDRCFKHLLRARHYASERSSQWFQDLVRGRELQAKLSTATATENRANIHDVPGLRKWLDQYESQVLGDKKFIESNASEELRNSQETKQQITTWRDEILTRRARSREALEIVLKFKSSEHTREEERVSSTMDRLLNHSFPDELLLKVVESFVGSQLPYCNIIESEKLETLAGKCFRWPRDIASDTREFLQRVAAEALLKVGTIKVSGDLTTSLRVLRGNENHLRRLVLEVKCTPQEYAQDRVLVDSAHSMAALGKSFPRLQTCVFLLHFINVGQNRSREPFDKSILRFHYWGAIVSGSRATKGAKV